VDLNLLEKTTFWIEGVELASADLGRLAAEAAAVLELPAEEVLVVDVRPGLLAFDVLRPTVRAEAILGKEGELLRRLGAVPGVALAPEAAVHSEGVLGFIALDPAQGAEALEGTRAMAAAVRQRVARRALVFASGSEVRDGKIRDTNSPYLVEALGAAGFEVRLGGVLEDDRDQVAGALEDAVGRGFGLVLTTGGVGAEDKDHNVEAVLRLDPGAFTPWILRFERDGHRHHKEGVRIAVGRVGPTLIVTLPGPHEEVRLAAGALLAGLGRESPDGELAEAVAGVLRERWQSMMHRHGGDHGRHRGPV
jgi:molybdenum cofactor synthesis domain-containing protein